MSVYDGLAARIIRAIRSGSDVYVFDRYVRSIEAAREVLAERRDESPPDEAAVLSRVIRELTEAADPAG